MTETQTTLLRHLFLSTTAARKRPRGSSLKDPGKHPQFPLSHTYHSKLLPKRKALSRVRGSGFYNPSTPPTRRLVPPPHPRILEKGEGGGEVSSQALLYRKWRTPRTVKGRKGVSWKSYFSGYFFIRWQMKWIGWKYVFLKHFVSISFLEKNMASWEFTF